VVIAAVACSFYKTPKERRHILHIGVSIGVHGRRVPGLNFAHKSCMAGYRGPIDNNRSSLLVLL
jgi:hypothetical protein